MKVLIACEESQAVCIEGRKLGHEVYSCDILECSGGHPEWHIQGDVRKILNPYDDGELKAIAFSTMDDEIHIVEKWDLIIAHPPCTYLTVTGNRWFDIERYGQAAIKRHANRREAAEFFFEFVLADCPRIAIENPIGYMSTAYRKPDQIIQPYMFGDPFEKKTCLWLKGLPLLESTNAVEPPERKAFANGKTMPAWYADAWHLPPAERAKVRSKTFPGIAKAMAEQWMGVGESEVCK